MTRNFHFSKGGLPSASHFGGENLVILGRGQSVEVALNLEDPVLAPDYWGTLRLVFVLIVHGIG